jgi:hypothetical protein
VLSAVHRDSEVKGRRSFFKKRTKKLLLLRGVATAVPRFTVNKVFLLSPAGSLFVYKKKCFLPANTHYKEPQCP